ncbi:MAG: hypothetical protein II721_02375, partial [Bacilli bacterium]|nr:hypothetical protein [Bacilli bacterium]
QPVAHALQSLVDARIDRKRTRWLYFHMFLQIYLPVYLPKRFNKAFFFLPFIRSKDNFKTTLGMTLKSRTSFFIYRPTIPSKWYKRAKNRFFKPFLQGFL